MLLNNTVSYLAPYYAAQIPQLHKETDLKKGSLYLLSIIMIINNDPYLSPLLPGMKLISE